MSRVIIAGASGLIGSSLVTALKDRGDEVVRLVRRGSGGESSPGAATWDPSARQLDPSVLEGADAVIVLNGASIARIPWTRSYRRTLAVSRRDPVRTVVTALHTMQGERPRLLSASAVGYYGSRPGERLTETDPAGTGFLAGLCEAWEREALSADDVTDVSLLRTASLLDQDALLRPLIPLTLAGLAGPLGPGDQVLPWITREDEVRAILHVLEAGLTGPVNLASPARTTFDELGREVADRLHRPYWLPVPAPLLRATMGRGPAEGLLLADADVRPTALEDSGFTFRHPGLGPALDAALTH